MSLFRELKESEVKPDVVLTDLAGDLTDLGVDPDKSKQIAAGLANLSPLLFQGYDGDAYSSPTPDLSVTGRGVFHRVPLGSTTAQLYVKGIGSWRALAEEKTRADYLGFDLSAPYLLRNDPMGALNLAAACDEYTLGLILAAEEHRDLLSNYGLRGVEALVKAGGIFPTGVAELNGLTAALNREYGAYDDKMAVEHYGSVGSLVPVDRRFGGSAVDLADIKDIELFKDGTIVDKIADGILARFKLGLCYDFSSWHPQNLYRSLDAENIFADAGDLACLGSFPDYARLKFLVPGRSYNFDKKQLQKLYFAIGLKRNVFIPRPHTQSPSTSNLSPEEYRQALTRFVKGLTKELDNPPAVEFEDDGYTTTLQSLWAIAEVMVDHYSEKDDRWQQTAAQRAKILGKYAPGYISTTWKDLEEKLQVHSDYLDLAKLGFVQNGLLLWRHMKRLAGNYVSRIL